MFTYTDFDIESYINTQNIELQPKHIQHTKLHFETHHLFKALLRKQILKQSVVLWISLCYYSYPIYCNTIYIYILFGVTRRVQKWFQESRFEFPDSSFWFLDSRNMFGKYVRESTLCTALCSARSSGNTFGKTCFGISFGRKPPLGKHRSDMA